MKFLGRPWYFKGEALAKHPMGKCAKPTDQSSVTPSVCEQAHMTLISTLLGDIC